MLKRLMRMIPAVGVAVLAIVVLFFTLGDQVAAGAASTHRPYASHYQTATPTVLQVDPNQAANNLDTCITIVWSG